MAVLLTYDGLASWADWEAFVEFVQSEFLQRLFVLYWFATLEQCKGGRWHTHLMLQFRKKLNTRAAAFKVHNWKPNIRQSGVGPLGQPLLGGRHNQSMVDRGFFYVFADKIGTVVAFSGEILDEVSGPDPFTEHSPALNPNLKARDIREAFKGDEYQVLLVANKFQTGFDQPLLCGMYVDKRLAGIQAVQTLS